MKAWGSRDKGDSRVRYWSILGPSTNARNAVIVLSLLAVHLGLATSTSADTLVLKDGKAIEWKTITDAGDSYTVETSKGEKITVKKADVKTLSGEASPVLLTGASITFDKKEKLQVVDLLSRLDLKKDALTGSWKLAAGALVAQASGDASARLQFSGFAPPDEYDLSMVLERKEGGGSFEVGIVGDGHQVAFRFELFKTFNGLACVEGKSVQDSPYTIVQGLFEPKKPRALVFMVRKNAFVVRLDGKDFYSWKADWSKAVLESDLAVQSKNCFFLETNGGGATWNVSKVIVTSVK
jgi:hypothetical protein